MKLYYVIHAVTVILVYTDSLPDSLKDKKDKIALANIRGYMLTIGCPGHHWLKTFLTLTPMWLTACYFQAKSEAALKEEIMQFLPEELLA